ncbi:MAG TPA: hypothetical protein VKA46_29725 [Gemmataceae bacterium]|nr:hypothetical protein [Gemmataceae bacterium]
MRQGLRFAAAALLAVAFAGMTVFGAGDDKPKYDIETIMDKAHGEDNDKILKKVQDGKASDAEKKQLLELYTELGKNKPPKGEAKSWKEKTTALVSAAKEVVDGKEEGVAHLKKAANCKGCHSVHKGD